MGLDCVSFRRQLLHGTCLTKDCCSNLPRQTKTKDAGVHPSSPSVRLQPSLALATNLLVVAVVGPWSSAPASINGPFRGPTTVFFTSLPCRCRDELGVLLGTFGHGKSDSEGRAGRRTHACPPFRALRMEESPGGGRRWGRAGKATIHPAGRKEASGRDQRKGGGGGERQAAALPRSLNCL